jgi:putative transposase
MLELPIHKPIRLEQFNYLGQKQYFVTICCFERHAVFLDARLSVRVLNLLRSESAANSFGMHAYCLMPDHLHFLVEGVEPASDLRHLVKSFKIKSSRQYSGQSGGILWQKRFYDHILRGSDSMEAVAWYIWLNPVRKGLVSKPDDYPYVGSCTGKVMPSEWNAPEWCPPWKKRRGPDL